MKRSNELFDEATFAKEQETLAENAMLALGEIRKYYHAQYSLGMGSSKEGTFAGLSCRSCKKWIEYGHESTCAVSDVEKLLKERNGNQQ